MEYLKNIQFFFDDKEKAPRDCQCDFNNSMLIYNIEVDSDYLETHDGHFHFTAQFSEHIICDVKLHRKIISIVSTMDCHSILFDGFLCTENNRQQVKPIFLKSLEKIKELIKDQTKCAEEGDLVIEFDVYKCQCNYQSCMTYKDSDKKVLQGDSDAGFVEATYVDRSKSKPPTDCEKADRILSGKIKFIIINQVEEKIYDFFM